MNEPIRQLMRETRRQPPMRMRSVSPNGAVLRDYGNPQHRVVWSRRKRVAAKICQVDEALRLDAVLLHPPEGRHEIRPPTALG